MNESLDIISPDLPEEALALIATRIDGANEIDESPTGFISCAVIQMMRATELKLQLGEGTFDLMVDEFRARLIEFCKVADNLVELPGAKFCMVLPDLTSLDHLELATAKLRRVLTPPINVVNHAVLVQTNAGFSITRVASARPGILYQAAESALGRCSPAERYVIYDPETVNRESDTWAIKIELEEALQKGELIPYFEPVQSTAFENVIAGASTLAWNSPKRGLQGFGRFLNTARDCEMLRPVYWQYLKGAIGQANKCQQTVGVVTPVPAEPLVDDEVSHQLLDALDLYSITPQRLTIDVPESTLSNADSRVILESIRQKKISVRISGMGDGGLPLTMLGNLPIDEVSVSRALLSKSVPPALRTLILELFKRAGYRLIATGIKEEKLLPKLKELGFHAIQGAAVGAIQPYNEFAGWLKKKVGT